MKQPENNTKFVTVITTANSIDECKKIAKSLIEDKLAACVQFFPITSCYMWEEKFQTEPENLILIKTSSHLYTQVEKSIKEIHSYTTPEIICLDIHRGSNEYLGWIQQMTKRT